MFYLGQPILGTQETLNDFQENEAKKYMYIVQGVPSIRKHVVLLQK